MVISPVGLGTKNHCAGEGQQQFSSQLHQYRREAILGLKSYDGKGSKLKFSYGWQVMPKFNHSTKSRVESPEETQL
jgi:hypothetical protein